MSRFNVYKQIDGRLIRSGQIDVAIGEKPLDVARRETGISWPVVHELDERGREKPPSLPE